MSSARTDARKTDNHELNNRKADNTGSRKIRIAQAQMPVVTGLAACLNYMEAAAEKTAKQDAQFLLFPEMFCCPYDTSFFPYYAEEEGGPLWTACADIARKYGIYFSAGTMPERDRQGRIYNTACIFDPEGRQIAKHRKMHLFDIQVQGGQHFRESDVLSAGDSVTVFDTIFGTFGLAVCFDIRFPELFRLMALKGARIILVPAAFNMTTGPRHWELLFRSQALNNQIFTIGTAPARNPSASYVSWGHSIVADPWGDVISQMSAEEDFRITEIDPEETRRAREQIPALTGRRTDVYTLMER